MIWTKNRTRALIAGLVVIAIVIPLGVIESCYTTTRPPRITRSQRALIKSTHFSLSVGVEKDITLEDGANFEALGSQRDLVRAMQRSGLFDRVDRLGVFKEPPDLVARVDGDAPSPPATIPLASLVTLGLFPTWYKEESGLPFSLRRPGTALTGPALHIRYIYAGHSLEGWLAVPLNLLPNHTWHDLDEDPRFVDHFAWEIVKHRREIEALAAGKPHR